MSVQPPKIDQRTYEEIVAQTERLAQKFTEWRPSADGKPDAGRALIRIFGRMAALVSDRLNQAPEKNFLAFLDTIGTQMLPPLPARVPLTFNLVSGSPQDAYVPAATQVAAPPNAVEEEVVFETERDLALISAQLLAVFISEPGTDKYSDCTACTLRERTASATGNLDAAFKGFEGQLPIERYLYVARDDLFTLPETKTVILTVYTSQASTTPTLSLTWEYWDGASWQSVQPTLTQQNNSLTVAIPNFPVPARTSINGLEAAWLRIALNTPASANQSLPLIDAIATRVEIQRNNLIAPDSCFFNSALLDLSKDFYPFGEQPRFNDTFYLASQEVFAKAQGNVTIDVKLSDLAVNKNGGAEILWEAYNGSNWEKLGQSNVSSPRVSGQANFNDQTQAFTQAGQITFTLPNQMKSTTVLGVRTYWVRARLIKGNYGTPASYRQTTTLPNQTSIQPVPASFAPPSVQSIGLKYTYKSQDVPLTACQTYNNFAYADCTAELLGDGSRFQPFTRSTDARPTLYLGFDQPFPNRTIALYFQVEPPFPGEIANAPPVTTPARVVWEYASPTGWVPLGVQDETGAFSERGQIRFIGPQDFSSQSEFGQSLYWLRARWESGSFVVSPRLRQVLTNTTWASQAVTIANEVLGSSDGNPNQKKRIAQTPILLGQRLLVFELTPPDSAEQAAIQNLEGANAIEIVNDEGGQIQGAWVTWHEVPDFYESRSRDRHYVIDRVGGEVRFGNGINGMIPPAGYNNIILIPYRTGGGLRGNVPANTITELKTTVPYVGSVLNLEAAAGGADRESLDRLQKRGPSALRHRGRAVTIEDMEDLALEATTAVARALAIGPHFNPIDGLDWLPIYNINLDAPGDIKVELSNPPDGLTLEVKINGPGQAIPYASKQLNKSNPTMTYTASQQQFNIGTHWSVTFTNLGASVPDNVIAKITYPWAAINADFQAPGIMSNAPSNPYQGVKDAGRVVLVIVPLTSERQPTPSLSLLERVRNYISQRCSPYVDVEVTEPDWMEVTVIANIVPSSLEKADDVKQAATNALMKFLHPLTGDAQGRGWAFGRRPHQSDLYALLEKIDGLDHVESLTITSNPSLDQIPAERRDRFLIYSGAHQINLISPGEGA